MKLRKLREIIEGLPDDFELKIQVQDSNSKFAFEFLDLNEDSLGYDIGHSTGVLQLSISTTKTTSIKPDSYYDMMIHNAADYLRNTNPNIIDDDNPKFNAFQICDIISIMTCKLSGDVLLDILKIQFSK